MANTLPLSWRGVFDLDDAARMIVARARLMLERCARGRMLVLFADRQQVDALLRDCGTGAAVAVVNGPRNHVLSGTPAAIEHLAELAKTYELRCVPLAVSHAFHSPMMEPMLAEFEQVVKQTCFTRPQLGFISSALGRSADHELIEPAYWVSQVRDAVLFEQAIAALAAEADWVDAAARVCIELGPHKQLIDMARGLPAASSARWLNVLQMGNDFTAFAETMHCLYLSGLPLKWPRSPDNAGARLPLPGYPFSKERYWLAGVNRSTASNQASDYEVKWCDISKKGVTGALQGQWLLLVDDDEFSDLLSKAMIQAGAKVQVCTLATFNANTFSDVFSLTEIDAVLYYTADIACRPGSQLVVNVLNVITALCPDTDAEMPDLFCVLDSNSVGYQPLASSIAGLCRSVREEEKLAITLIGLDDSLQVKQRVSSLVNEISTDRGGEWERRIIGAKVLTPRLTVLPANEADEKQTSTLQSDHCYLITGGTGSLGRLFAKELLALGARDLVLLARRVDNAVLVDLHEQAVICGARLSIYSVDLANGEAIQACFKKLRQAHAPLAGIIHAAGQLADAPFRQLDTAAFARAFDVKAIGAWWLDQLSADMDLDFFVMISSISSVLGAAGQANYASANAYLDGLIVQRREQGKTGLSLRLGAVAGSGMAAEHQVVRQLHRLGIVPLAPSLLRVRCGPWLRQSAPLAMLADFDWLKICGRQENTVRPLLATLMPSHTESEVTEPEMASVTKAQCEPAAVEQIVLEAIAAILDMPDPQSIVANDTLNALGMDSVTLVELREQLQRQLGCDIPTRLLFDFPQVGKLISHLQTVLHGKQDEAVAVKDGNDRLDPRTGISDSKRVDIAIVGMGCRFPGGVNSPETFWSGLLEGRDLIGQIDTLRWDALSLVQKGELATDRAGVIDNIEYFDCNLFGITPREAQCMDPQQRLLLETGWEALERAGYDFSSNDTLGGVFIGPGPNDYVQRFPKDTLSLSHHHSTGNALSVTAGRLAFTLDWQGPALAVDTACSSSLMAVHLAVQSLRQGECDIALAGGVNLLLSPETSVLLSKGSMLAPDGRCKTFDAKANGYVRSEGCGMVVLKRLDDAIADGDKVLAVLRGSATNQDGHSQGLTAPNGQAQQQVLRRALADAAVDPAQVELLEAHGTGTPLGDPIEIAAAQAVYVDDVVRQSPLWVSSVKSNMGHAEAAAGIAGMIKAVLCLTQQTIAPHLHLSRLNPEIQLDASTLRIPDEPQEWQDDHVRYAAVSSFGFSGTNVHLILQSAPEHTPSSEQVKQAIGLRISAASDTALNEMMRCYRNVLVSLPEQQYKAFCQQTWRRAVLGHTRIFEDATQKEMLAALELALGELVPMAESCHKPSSVAGISLPCYPFERQRFWQQSPGSQQSVLTLPHSGLRLSSKQASLVVYVVDYVQQPPFNLQDHLVHGDPVVPAAAHLALIIGMLDDLRGRQNWEITDVLCEEALVIDADTEVVHYQFTVLSDEEGGGVSIEVLSDVGSRTQRHLRARACAAQNLPRSVAIPSSARALAKIDGITFYERLSSPEIRLSNSFRSIVSIEQYQGYTVSEIAWTGGEHSAIVPGELDALLQTIALATMAEQPEQSRMGGATIPVAIDRLIFAPRKNTERVQAPTLCQTRLLKQDENGGTFVHDLTLAEQGEKPFLSVEGLITRRVSAQQIKRVTASSSYLVEKWQAQSLADDSEVNKLSEHNTLVFVLLNNEDDFVDSGWRKRLSDAGTLFDVDSCDLDMLKRTTEGRFVSLVYCLPALARMSENSEQTPWIQQAMALVAAARRAHQLSELLAGSGIDVGFRVLSSGYVDHTGTGGGSPLYGFALGLCKSLDLEWQEYSVGMLDIDGSTFDQRSAVMADEVRKSRVDWVAYHHAQRYVLRIDELQASSMKVEPDFHCHDDGLYLLSGGLGDLAVATCHWLVQRGGKHFLLLGRRAEDADISQQLAQLRDATGADIDYQTCDVANRQVLAALLDQLNRPLRGIFHCAGVLADGAFTTLTDDDFERVICAKMLGSWHLHELTRDMRLDCFVMYSSLASLLGAAGQSNYAAANGFMDQLAHYRRGLGLPALAINWAGWDEIGMAVGRSSSLGLRLLSPTRAIADLERALASAQSQLGVIDVDWPVFAKVWRDSPPALVEDWFTAHQSATERLTAEDNSDIILQDLLALPALAKVEAVREHLRLMAREIMKLDDSRALDDHKPFLDLGFDSLMSIELKQKLQKSFQIRVPATLVFDYPNVESLSAYVMQALSPKDTETGTELPTQADSLDDLDEDQLAQMLETLL
ncbi:SDR family NAD(P)-dependent oxidoreductase [Shewanella sp. VB17]|uniref:type I polyketide synthase n=1 Tax=Shewanella sp. VB17 TaxID=2739432 RepID=UPI0015660CF0|nr:type I polyketide synthase [Shewanella sp. VB17]NRD72189.1 SDR family NAD(P)-dependent oxidoreductase [Shewanella sp. VB17]